jgi:hypothetical protein
VAAQPREFRRLHFGRERAPRIAQRLVAARVRLIGLGDGAVIHPHDDVPLWVACGRDADGLVVGVQCNERAGRVVADAQHRVGLDARLADHRAHDGADRPPDVLRRLLGVFGQRAVDLDGFRRECQPFARQVKQPRPRTRRADIDADNIACHAVSSSSCMVNHLRARHHSISKVAAEVFFSAQVDFAPAEKRR